MPYMILYRQVLLRDSSKLSCIADSYNQEKSLIRQTYPKNHQGENVFPWVTLACSFNQLEIDLFLQFAHFIF